MWRSCTGTFAGVTISASTRSCHVFSRIIPIVYLLLCAAEQGVGQLDELDPVSSLSRYDGYGTVFRIMKVMLGIIAAVILLTGFLLTIYFRHCYRNRRGDIFLNGGEGVSRRIAAARGLDASIIETFPMLVYAEVKTLKFGEGVLECAVCLNEFEDQETLRLLPICDHVFHPHCIDVWLRDHRTCPVCRSNLAEQKVAADPVEIIPPERTEAHDGVLERVSDQTPEPTRVEEPEKGIRGALPDPPRVIFPRSHTTGHSLVLLIENTDRFILRLPDEVKKNIMTNWKMKRSKSLVVLPRGGSSRRGAPTDRFSWFKTPTFLRRNSQKDGSTKPVGTGQTERNTMYSGCFGSVRPEDFSRISPIVRLPI